ncbi:MAG TPA: cobalamin-independent methionine synthase II family protein [Chloroflexia bacterium]|nr:cobalamin-independent methionine synthase II family protein [Chloroflexia bacterium]
MFPVTTVGSWPRSPALVRALRDRQRGRISAAAFDAIADGAVLSALAAQEAAGVDLVSDGEQRRDNFFSFVADKLEGVRLMSLAELLDYIEDKAGFEEILGTLDVPAYSMMNPTAVGRIARRAPLAGDEYRFLRAHTTRPIKVPLPGPYLLMRAMWVEGLSQATYPTKEHLADDVVAVLREELIALRDAGVDFVQFDEPVLTELVFSARGAARTFMCAALSTRSDPREELAFAVDLINRVVQGVEGTRIGVHICRGNWSTEEAVLLRGPYTPLLPYLAGMQVDQLVLEYATPRAGEVAAFGTARLGKELGLGVVNPRTVEIEPVASIIAQVEDALGYLAPDQIFLNPDCGFGTFASRPMNSPEVAGRKLVAMTQAAQVLRSRFARV